jgi:hypothetical protein
MRTVEMLRDFDYFTHTRRFVRFYRGIVYTRVIEAAADAIVNAGAGRIVQLEQIDVEPVDASDAWCR